MEFEEAEGTTIHYGGEDFTADAHQHYTMPFIGIRKIAWFGNWDALACMPSIVFCFAFKENSNVCMDSSSDFGIHFFVGFGGMPFRPGLFPFLILLMAASTSSKVMGESMSWRVGHWPQLRRAPIKFGRFIKLYNINVKVL
jgi:hypothetical protein